MNKELKDTIIKKQGDLLYTTLSEECAELIQACSKIIRCKYTDKNNIELFNNICEEINDVEMNLELIKVQIFIDYLAYGYDIDKNTVSDKIKEWNRIKTEKLNKIFLKDKKNEL